VTDNLLLKAIRDCRRSGKSRIEMGNWEIESVTADQAADFLYSQLINFSIGRIVLSGSSKMSIREAIETIPNCKIDFVEYPHRLKFIPPPQNSVVVIEGNIGFLVRSIFDFVETPSSLPYFSLILTGRHDEYLKGFETRVNVFFRHLDRLYAANPTVDFEIIFVDYAGNHSLFLKDVIEVPASLRPILKWLIVPPEVSQEYGARHHTNRSFHEYFAKNIGARRSRGQFLLFMNPDSLPSFQFFEASATRPFNPGVFYMGTRFATIPRLLNSMPFEDLRHLTEEPWLQQMHKLEDFVPNGRLSMFFIQYPWGDHLQLHTGAGDCQLISRELFEAIGGFHEVGFDAYVDHFLVIKLSALIPGFVRNFMPFSVIHQWHEIRGSDDPYNMSVIMDAFWKFRCHGRSDSFGNLADPPDWGALNRTFQMIDG
jgi:hypothetical protein